MIIWIKIIIESIITLIDRLLVNQYTLAFLGGVCFLLMVDSWSNGESNEVKLYFFLLVLTFMGWYALGFRDGEGE